jgi:hypothetical protein
VWSNTMSVSAQDDAEFSKHMAVLKFPENVPEFYSVRPKSCCVCWTNFGLDRRQCWKLVF